MGVNPPFRDRLAANDRSRSFRHGQAPSRVRGPAGRSPVFASFDLATDRSAVVDLTEVIVGLYLRKQLRKQGLPLGRRDHDPSRLGGQRHWFIRIDPASIAP